MSADKQEIDGVGFMTKNDAALETDPKFIETFAQFAQAQMRVRFSECFRQRGNRILDLILNCWRQRIERAAELPRRLDSHLDLALAVRLARRWAT